MDIQKLKAFMAVVEESNISRATVRLNMQQPPLTRIIKVLEEELNTPEKYPNVSDVYPNLLDQGCCGGSCSCGK